MVLKNNNILWELCIHSHPETGEPVAVTLQQSDSEDPNIAMMAMPTHSLVHWIVMTTNTPQRHEGWMQAVSENAHILNTGHNYAGPVYSFMHLERKDGGYIEADYVAGVIENVLHEMVKDGTAYWSE